jgi:hypothetical protein
MLIWPCPFRQIFKAFPSVLLGNRKTTSISRMKSRWRPKLQNKSTRTEPCSPQYVSLGAAAGQAHIQDMKNSLTRSNKVEHSCYPRTFSKIGSNSNPKQVKQSDETYRHGHDASSHIPHKNANANALNARKRQRTHTDNSPLGGIPSSNEKNPMQVRIGIVRWLLGRATGSRAPHDGCY